jgi:hypothetical protein
MMQVKPVIRAADYLPKAIDLSILELVKYDHKLELAKNDQKKELVKYDQKIEENRKGDNIREQFISMYEASFAQETKNNLSEQAEQVLRINAMVVTAMNVRKGLIQ